MPQLPCRDTDIDYQDVLLVPHLEQQKGKLQRNHHVDNSVEIINMMDQSEVWHILIQSLREPITS